MIISKETKQLQEKIASLLADSLTEDELSRIVDVQLCKTDLDIEEELDYISHYYILAAAGKLGYMWMGTGVTPPEPIELPDPNEEYRRRMSM